MKKILFSVLLIFGLISVLAMPVSVLATNTGSGDNYDNYTVEQLEALIVKLQKRLEEMKKGSLCFISDINLSLGDGEAGDNSDAVKRLQNFLAEKGYFKYKATGYFGKITRTALIAYQKAAGITQTGEFDNATREKAHALYCKNGNLKNKGIKDKEKEDNGAVVSNVSNITVQSSGGNNISWTVQGKSPMGYKVVWSKNSGPTYPTREGDTFSYYSDPSSASATLNAFNGFGEYHVRVCEYLGSKCGAYSNEITISL